MDTTSKDSSTNDEDTSLNEIDVLKEKLEKEKRKSKAYWETIKTLRSQKTVEYRVGNFEQKITRHGKKRKVNTIRKGKSEHKLTLAWIGNAEIFCYPFDSVEKVLMRIENRVISLDKFTVPSFMRAYNNSTWYFEHAKDIIRGETDSKSPLAKELLYAYGAGQQKDLIKTKTLQARIDREKELELFDYMYGLKESIRLKWLNEEPQLVTRYRKYVKKRESELSKGDDNNEP